MSSIPRAQLEARSVLRIGRQIARHSEAHAGRRDRSIERRREVEVKLTDREREVLELRFGLKDGKDHTLEEVSRYP